METNKTTIESINKMNTEELITYLISFKGTDFEENPHFRKAVKRAKENKDILILDHILNLL